MEALSDGRRGWRRWLVRALFESALIMVSIVVALAVTEWRDQRQLHAEARGARIAFAREIEANAKALVAENGGLPQHRKIWQRYREVGAKPVLSAADLQ